MLDELTDANVTGMVKALLTKKRKLSAKTAEDHRRYVCSLWRWIAEQPTKYGLRDFPGR